MASDPVKVALILPIDRRRGRGWRRWIIIPESLFRLLTHNYGLAVTAGKGFAPDRRRCLRLAAFACALLDLLVIILMAPSSAESSYSDNLDRRYSLISSLELNYDRRWFQGVGSDVFRQVLLLEQRGYVSDPQLLTYQISANGCDIF